MDKVTVCVASFSGLKCNISQYLMLVCVRGALLENDPAPQRPKKCWNYGAFILGLGCLSLRLLQPTPPWIMLSALLLTLVNLQ